MKKKSKRKGQLGEDPNIFGDLEKVKSNAGYQKYAPVTHLTDNDFGH
jgi:hypothetical protein